MPDSWIERVRLKFERDFTMTPNEWARDSKLSLGARGLLTLLLSHDAGFKVSVKSLARDNPEGRYAIDTLVRELKQRNYLEHVLVRGSHGRIDGVVWRMTDPAEVERLKRAQPQLGLPGPGKPGSRLTRDPENLHLKEAQQEEDLYPGLSIDTSTRAGDEEERSAPLPPCRDSSDKQHHFASERAGGFCTHCGKTPRELHEAMDVTS